MRFQDTQWTISTSSLVILAASVFEISCEKQTDRQTDKRRWNSSHLNTSTVHHRYITNRM